MSEHPIHRLFERACRHSARGRPRAALAVYAQVLAVTRERRYLENAHWGSAEVLVGLSCHREAIEHLEAAVRLNAGEASYHVLLGQSWLAAGDPLRALESFRRAVELAPRDAEAHRLLGWALARRGDRAAGAHELARAVFLDRGNLRARIDLALVLSAQGLHGAALDLARSARRADPHSKSLRDTCRVLELASRAAGEPEPARRRPIDP